ncbi:hypothetical protein SAMN04488096_104150 [Mesonia phycicola]|uniref:Adenylosuccinate lyase n=1 Tax=Mesonia phycicola TaxID=579105 RepID=A0A1M6DT03_9FLAO|nr:hypothetical protein [Mesonia phycicola]SHI76303.1 hypothetical protein SAMN04488096_104150 [Mesonia phycicola]
MNSQELLEELLKINAQPENRKITTQKILAQPDLIKNVLAISKKNSKKVSGKATRVLELVCKINALLIFQHKKEIIKLAETAKLEDVVRPLAKIFELWTLNYFSEEKEIQLQPKDQEKIISICFDWLITPQKMAPQAYSMLTLYLLGKENDWVHPELKSILEQNYASGSAGYKARARQILKNINKTTF